PLMRTNRIGFRADRDLRGYVSTARSRRQIVEVIEVHVWAARTRRRGGPGLTNIRVGHIENVDRRLVGHRIYDDRQLRAWAMWVEGGDGRIGRRPQKVRPQLRRDRADVGPEAYQIS